MYKKMSNLTKTQKEKSVNWKIDKISDELNLNVRKLVNKFIDGLVALRTIIEWIEKVSNRKELEIEKKKDMTRKVLKQKRLKRYNGD